VASVALVVLVLGIGLAWWRGTGSGGSDKVAVVPGEPAVQLPHVGLLGKGDLWTLRTYSPGREEELWLSPSGSSPNLPYGLVITPDGSAGPLPPRSSASAEVGTVRGQPATALALSSDTPAAVVVWEIAPGMKALLGSQTIGSYSPSSPASSTTATTEPVLDRALAAKLFAIADRIGPVDDATWWHALQSGYPSGRGFDFLAPLVLEPPDGTTEVSWTNPGLGFTAALDVHGHHLSLTTLSANASNQGSAARDRRVHGVPAGFNPDERGNGVEDLSWHEHGEDVTLTFGPGLSESEALAIANSLVVPSESQWHALLEPAFLRTDLVPMPTDVFGRIFSVPQQGSFQGQRTQITTPTTTH
jgi:hypothetical protein